MAEEGVLSLQDVLEEDQQLEQTANAVLGDSDDSQCTYPKGYVQRQAVYACGTCVTPDMEPAGLCLGCSLHCHDGHQLYELYTKRYFGCDCGNSKFPGFTCSLCPEKESSNSQNKYNHNFCGLYCTCDRPYPDSEDEVEDEMLQCSVCEDWFHSRHLGNEVPTSYEEMVCDGCMQAHEFLKAYQLHPQPVVVGKEKERQGGDGDREKTAGNGKTAGEGSVTVTTQLPEEGSSSGNVCELARRKAVLGASWQVETGAAYFESGWRAQLCRCTACKSLHTSTDTLYLLDEGDTIASYEARGQSRPTTHDAGMAALSSSLDRVQQVEVLSRYNEMKSELVDYLKGFAREGKVVSKRDIDGFFEEMQARKRPKLESGDGVPPHHCHF